MATSSEMLVHERLKEDPKLATVTVKGAKRKRAYHPKVKTGCLTCKYVVSGPL